MPPKSILYPLVDINDVLMLERTCDCDPRQGEKENARKISVEGIPSNHIRKRYTEILNHKEIARN